jgi:hypothetical protein
LETNWDVILRLAGPLDEKGELNKDEITAWRREPEEAGRTKRRVESIAAMTQRSPWVRFQG